MKNYYLSLQGLRVFFFLNIFFFHILGLIGKRDILGGIFEGGGWLGVSGFFVLSGFLTATAFEKDEKMSLKKSIIFNIKKFFKKYYTLHIFFLIIMSPFTIIRLYSKSVSFSRVILALFFQLTMTQSQIPIEGITLSFNDISWYLSTMLFISALSYGLISILDKSKSLFKELTTIIFVTFLCPLIMRKVNMSPFMETWILYYSFPIRMLDFSVGAILGLIKRKNLQLFKGKKLIGLVIVTLLLIQIFFEKIPIEFRYAAIYVPIVGYLIYYCSDNISIIEKILSSKCLVYLGDLCIYFYFCHMAVIKYLLIILKRTSFYKDTLYGNILFVFSASILTFFVGILLKQLELRYRKMKQ